TQRTGRPGYGDLGEAPGTRGSADVPSWPQEPPVPLYPVVSSLATAEPGEGGGGSAEGSFVVAVRACGLVSPVGRPLRPGERSALVVGGTEKIRGGELA